MDKNIEIHIDRIVLEGFDHFNRAQLNAAVQEHLMSMIAQQGLPDRSMKSAHHRKLSGGEMNLDSRPKTGQMGNDIASGIINGINSTI